MKKIAIILMLFILCITKSLAFGKYNYIKASDTCYIENNVDIILTDTIIIVDNIEYKIDNTESCCLLIQFDANRIGYYTLYLVENNNRLYYIMYIKLSSSKHVFNYENEEICIEPVKIVNEKIIHSYDRTIFSKQKIIY